MRVLIAFLVAVVVLSFLTVDRPGAARSGAVVLGLCALTAVALTSFSLV